MFRAHTKSKYIEASVCVISSINLSGRLSNDHLNLHVKNMKILICPVLNCTEWSFNQFGEN